MPLDGLLRFARHDGDMPFDRNLSGLSPSRIMHGGLTSGLIKGAAAELTIAEYAMVGLRSFARIAQHQNCRISPTDAPRSHPRCCSRRISARGKLAPRRLAVSRLSWLRHPPGCDVAWPQGGQSARRPALCKGEAGPLQRRKSRYHAFSGTYIESARLSAGSRSPS